MQPKKVLIVLTSHGQLGDTGKSTGFYLSEVSHPHKVLAEAGIEMDFVSPKGGAAPIDGVDRDDPVNAAFLDNPDLIGRTENTLRPDQVDAADYGAIFYAGGHGTMWDFPANEPLQALARAIYEAGGAVAAVCHGPAGLVDIKLSSGAYLIAGRDVTGFSNAEEDAVGLSEVVPFHLESKLGERGGNYSAADNWQPHVVVSERVITGQNPASAPGVAAAIAKLLSL